MGIKIVMKRIIITGASGFLGKNFVLKALEKGTEVFAVVRDVGKLADIADQERLHTIPLDLEYISELPKVLSLKGFDAFYHFAWSGTAGREREDYRLQIRNAQAACEAVCAAKELKCEKFINAGSLMEYESIKFMEQPGQKPVGNYIYRSAKLAAHYIAKAEAGRLELPFVNLIISNVYGRGEVSGRFISATLQKILKDEKMDFTAGTQLYDFIYITDAAEAFYLVGKYGKPYMDYYIGSNEIRPLREYIERLFECLLIQKKPVFGNVSFDGKSLSYNEFERGCLERDAGFCCKVSFEEGIRETYEWLKNKWLKRDS